MLQKPTPLSDAVNQHPTITPYASPMPHSLKPRESSLLLELEPSTPSSPALPEEELLPTRSLPERTTMERLALLLLAIGIVPSIEPRPQFRVA